MRDPTIPRRPTMLVLGICAHTASVGVTLSGARSLTLLLAIAFAHGASRVTAFGVSGRWAGSGFRASHDLLVGGGAREPPQLALSLLRPYFFACGPLPRAWRLVDCPDGGGVRLAHWPPAWSLQGGRCRMMQRWSRARVMRLARPPRTC